MTLPLVSSQQLCAALRRAGFGPLRPAKGTHQAWGKKVGKRTLVCVVVLGKSEIARGTLASILDKAGLSEDEFVHLL